MLILFPGSAESFPDIFQCIVQGLLYYMSSPFFFGGGAGLLQTHHLLIGKSQKKMMVNPAVFGWCLAGGPGSNPRAAVRTMSLPMMMSILSHGCVHGIFGPLFEKSNEENLETCPRLQKITCLWRICFFLNIYFGVPGVCSGALLIFFRLCWVSWLPGPAGKTWVEVI